MEPIEIQVNEAPALLLSLWNCGLAFGCLYFPEKQVFKISICTPAEIRPIRSVNELAGQTSNCQNGFVAMPFDNSVHPGYFIPNNFEKSDLEQSFSVQLFIETRKKDINTNSTESEIYQTNVALAVQEIKNGNFNKLVVSRNKKLPFNDKRLGEFIENLISDNMQVNLCFFNLPGEGFWVSATPELLIENDGNKILKTMALAGTMRFHGQEIKGQGWTEKEIEEQALVSRYIKNCLKSTGNHFYEEKGPFTVQAGNLLHLRTDFLIKSESELNFGKLTDALHPTSAVCGSPRNEALEWIRNHEQFDREFFSGFAGILEGGFSKLVVILRTGKILDDEITLYAGAGITSSSQPEKEWDETEGKLFSIGKYLTEATTVF